MKVIALTQAYNEGLFIEPYIKHLLPLVDKWIITEGRLTPFGSLSERSTDCTRSFLEYFSQNDKTGKISVFDASPLPAPSREQQEGTNKNFMLSRAAPEDGDLIFIGDVDEFWYPEKFLEIINLFRKNDKLNNVVVEELQFAYNTELCFKASHSGRFMRYRTGAKFGNTNHFIHSDGKDVSKQRKCIIPRGGFPMCHFSWIKHPLLVREKVISFNRPSFTAWFNKVYLEWPTNPELAYKNNTSIPPYHGTGFAEGQHEKLFKFIETLPDYALGINVDWIDYLKEHRLGLKI